MNEIGNSLKGSHPGRLSGRYSLAAECVRNWKLFGHPSLTLAWLGMSDGFYLCMSGLPEQEEIFRDIH